MEERMRCPACESEIWGAAKYCSECGTQVRWDSAGGGGGATDRRGLVTALFADLSQSVATTHGLDPEDAEAVLAPVREVMNVAVERHGGIVKEDLGDGVLALFGAPRAHEDDAERAIRAALEIRDGLQARGLDGTAGIASGEVYLGHVSTGPTVLPVAARLQSACKPGQILVSDATYRLARRAFAFAPLTLQLKGIPDPVTAFEVQGILRAEKTRGIEGRRAALQERGEELATLEAAFRDAVRGEGRIAMLVGDAGVGKSRLVEELRNASQAESDHVLWLEGRCFESGTATSYLPFVEILRHHFGWPPDEDDQTRAHRVLVGLEQLAVVGCLPADAVGETAALLGNVLSIRQSSVVVAGVDPWHLKRRTLRAIAGLVGGLTCLRTVVLVIDDLQWSDSLSVDAVCHLLGALPQLRLLLVIVSRNEEEHKWQRIRDEARRDDADRYIEIDVGDLSEEATLAALESVLQTKHVPEALQELVRERTQGNPFFMEEIVRSLLERGALVAEGETWQLHSTSDKAALPPSVQRVICSRVDRLPQRLRTTLEVAAVIGRLFSRELLRVVLDDTDALDQSLWELENKSLIKRDQGPVAQYAFEHVLTQDAIYGTIPRERRADLHGRVADAIALLHADEPDAYVELLAYHYDRSGNPAAAVAHLARAGEKSRRRHLTNEAIAYFERGLERLAALDAETEPGWREALAAELHEGLGDALRESRQLPRAKGSYRAALVTAAQEDALRRARILRKLGWLVEADQDFPAAVDFYSQAHSELDRLDAPKSGSEAWEEWVAVSFRDAMARVRLEQGSRGIVDYAQTMADLAGRRSGAAPGRERMPSGPALARVLVIEDDDAQAVLWAVTLADAGMQVLSARDGRRGIETARAERPDLVLLDIHLPGALDGWEVAETLLGGDDTKSIAIVFLSAIGGGPRDEIRALELGALGYIPKLTVNPDQIGSQLMAVLKEVREAGSERVRAEKLSALRALVESGR